VVFSSALFLFYFLPIFLGLYFIVPKGWRNLYTAGASLLFYAWGAPDFLIIFLGSCLVDYLVTARIDGASDAGRRKAFLVVSLVLNLGLLLYFKYANFFVAQVGFLLKEFGFAAPHWHKVVLPIGISFFTFHKISYVIDVFRRTSKPARDFGEYILYITFFPQLIAGPIVRYHEIEGQIRERAVTLGGFAEGVARFVSGLAAKVLIADPLGIVADHVFGMKPENLSTAHAWLGTIAYTLQIYFDFSGYSSMAVGLALMVGFRFPENFNRPYLATSVTDFWRRWHMSLSRWMRDYLYIPLGGNRVSPFRQKVNLWTVFLISGFWHGANWSFIFWGAYHGAFLAFERTAVGGAFLKLPALLRRLTTVVVVMFGWVIFRAESLADGLTRWGIMVGLHPAPEKLVPVARASLISDFGLGMLLFGVLWCVFVEPRLAKADRDGEVRESLFSRRPILQPALVILLLLSVLALEAGSFSPFIYFQF